MPALEEFNQFIKTNFTPEKQKIINKMFEAALIAEKNRRKLTSDDLASLDFKLKKLCPDDDMPSLTLQPHAIIYVVVSDPYSDVYAVFTNKEKAAAYAAKHNNLPRCDTAVIQVYEADKY